MSQIENVLHEERRFPPSEEFRANAVLGSEERYQSMYRESIDAPELFWDRVAKELELDPARFRLMNLSHPRYLRVLKMATESFGWEGRERRPGTGYGVAVGFDAGSYTAQCVEVAVNDGQLSVKRVTAAFDCGAMFNPDGVKNQVEGSIVMGMGTALWEAVEFDGGRVLKGSCERVGTPRVHRPRRPAAIGSGFKRRSAPPPSPAPGRS